MDGPAEKREREREREQSKLVGRNAVGACFSVASFRFIDDVDFVVDSLDPFFFVSF